MKTHIVNQIELKTVPSNSFNSILQIVLQDFENKVNEIILDDNISTILKGGNRLRPILACITFKLCTGKYWSSKQYQRFLEGVVCIELAYGASLVHDYIINCNLYQKEDHAIYSKTKLGYVILFGHKMVSIGCALALINHERFVKLYVDTCRRILDGQLLEVNFNSKDITDCNVSADSKFFQLYCKIIDLKTSTLFSTVCKTAAIWTESSDELIDLLGEYGREVGFAYQLAVDLVSFEKKENNDGMRHILSRIINNSQKNDRVKENTNTCKKKKISPKIRLLYLYKIKQHLNKAQDLSQSDIFPDNKYKQILQQLSILYINKILKDIKISI